MTRFAGDLTPTTGPHRHQSKKYIVVSAGQLNHSCGITAENNAVCWGRDSSGSTTPPHRQKVYRRQRRQRSQLRHHHRQQRCLLGAEYLRLNNATIRQKVYCSQRQCSAPSMHTVAAFTLDNDAICWGLDFSGRTGSPSGQKFIAVSAGNTHSCGITISNDADCWGSNSNSSGSTPPSGKKFIAISSNESHNCGITADNEVACWGIPGKWQRTAPPQVAPAAAASITITATVNFRHRQGATQPQRQRSGCHSRRRDASHPVCHRHR